MKIRMLCIAAACAAAATSAQAQELTGTLKKIKDKGEIRLGYRQSSVPFSYTDQEMKPVGYAMELCDRVVRAVAVELKVQSVKATLVPIDLSSQIPLIQNGEIDLVCGPATNTAERQKQVAFSDTIYVSTIRAIVSKASGINSFNDLNGKTVAFTSASTSIPLATAYAQKNNLTINRVLGKDHAESFLLLSTNRAQAFVMDDILLASMAANSSKPGEWKILDQSLRSEPYGLILRKDDPQFKALVDNTLVSLMKSKEIEKIYYKWFNSPIPPKSININFPISADTQKAFSSPNDNPAAQ